jgi:hypothetical protein
VKDIIWSQFGASIEMLKNAINACPENLWSDRTQQPEFWYLVYHTLFWLDFYLTEYPNKYIPQEPYTLSELDPEGKLPDRVYTKDELLNYLTFCRRKCEKTLNNLTDEKAKQNYKFGSIEMSFGEIIIYNLRHVQHGTGQLNLILRQKIDSAPGWVKKDRKN